MNPIEINYFMRRLPQDKRVIVRRRMLLFVIIVSFCTMIGAGCFEAFKEKRREKAVELIVSEHYSLICNGNKKELSLHEYVSFATDDLAGYGTFRFDDESKTIRCTSFGNDLSVIILTLSLFLMVIGGAILMFTELFMSQPPSGAENKEETINEKR